MNRARPISVLDTLSPIWINAQCRNWLLQRIASELTLRKPLNGDERFDPAEFLVASYEGDTFGLSQSGGEGIGVREWETGFDMGGRQGMGAIGDNHIHRQLLYSR